MSRWRVCLGVVVAAGVLLVAASFGAEGGSTIASAPVLVWGQVESGVGGNNVAGTQPWGYGGKTFWRVHVFVGDRITGAGRVKTSNGCATNRVVLFGPTVNDGTLGAAKPLVRSGTIFQNSCVARTFSWIWARVPVTGLATLWAAISSEAPTFTLVARVHHLTAVTLRAATVTGATAALHAQVTSIAGVPTGICSFDLRVDGGAWQHASQAATNRGACAAKAPVAAKQTLQVRVRFLSSKEWLPSTATGVPVRVG